MRKTTIYLNDDEAERLQRMASTTGRSQSELIREGVRHVLRGTGGRKFHSMGIGESGGPGPLEWDPDELYEHVMGRDRQ
jgi:hypothetical protein